MEEVTPIELDILLLCFTFADSDGRVDVTNAQRWIKDKMGITLPVLLERFEQKHLDILMDREVLVDIRPLINKLKSK